MVNPKKFKKHVFYVETLRRKNGTDLVQNQSIEFEVVRLDRFCCPIALTIAVQNLCVVLLSHLFWRLYAITNHTLNVSHSTRFLLFLSIVKFHLSSKNPCSEFLSPTMSQSTDSMRDVLVSG